jgi:hypothetical protein
LALTATETKAQTIIEQIRTAHRAFEAARQVLVGLLDATGGLYEAAGGNNLTDTYLLAHGANGTIDQLTSLTQAEWQAYWPTLRAAVAAGAMNLSLSKGFLP